MKTVAITGSSGFIGTTLREHLFHRNLRTTGVASIEDADLDTISQLKQEENLPYKVIGLDREHPSEMWYGHELVPVDLLDAPELMQALRWFRPDVVVHAAAQARVNPSKENPIGTYRANAEATINVLGAAQAVGVDHFIYLSSEAIYGEAREYPTPENSDFRPANPYAASKVAGDVMVQAWNQDAPETCVVRSGMGWGPRQDPSEQVVAKFIEKALRDEPLKFPEGDVDHPTRDLNHVEDFARGVERIIGQEATGVYNLSGGREYTILEIAERIVDAVGSGEVAFTDDFSYREGEEGFRTWLDVSKAEQELGHVPKRHFEGDALRDVIDWYRDNLD